MSAKLLRLLLLSVLIVAGCLLFAFRAQTRSLRIADLYHQSSQDALANLGCDLDSPGKTCLAPTQKQQSADDDDDDETLVDTTSQAATPTRLDYPSGFEQFDTSSPKSPYRQDIYGSLDETEDEKVISTEGATHLKQLMTWVPYMPKYTAESHNPVIWQTFKDEPAETSTPFQSWIERNQPKWSRTFVPQAEIEAIITRMTREYSFLKDTFDALPSRVLQIDFLRYLKLFTDGGVYADVDTSCYAPIDSWYAACYTDTPSSAHGQRVRSSQPGLIVGVEFDLQGDLKVSEVDGRQLALANYVFAANKGHPVLAKMIDSIVQSTPVRLSSTFDITNYTHVHEWTGRKVWTDTIIAHIQETVQGFKAHDLLGMKKAKMYGDVCILPIQAFGSGQLKYKNSPDSTSEGVMVKEVSE